MVCFEDLHVVSVTEGARGRLDKPERDVNAGRHVRRLHDRDLSRRRRDTFILLRRKSGRSDHHAHALPQARLQVSERSLGTGEIDQAVAACNCVVEAGSDLHAAGAPDQFSGILADDGASGNLHRRRELEIPRCEGHLDQCAPHAASRAGDDKLHCPGFPGTAEATISPSTRFTLPSSKNTAMRRYSISRDRKSTRLNSSHTVISYA